MFFLYNVKSGLENEFEIRFVQFDLFKEKIGIFNWNSISGKNNSEKSWRKRWNQNIAQHIFPSRTGVGVRVSSGSSEDVFSEDSDSNALTLVHDSAGDNPESLGESGPRP